MATAITKEDVSALIGRPLSSMEIKYFDLYSDIAQEMLKNVLCYDFTTEKIPSDLKIVLANLFKSISDNNAIDSNISSKRVEDFSIQYKNDYNTFKDVFKKFSLIIARYSRCDVAIEHGKTIIVNNSNGLNLDDVYDSYCI